MIDFAWLKASIEDGTVNETNIACHLHGTPGWWLSALKWLSDIAVAGNAGLAIPAHDHESFSYVGSTNNIDTITYYVGGPSGEVVGIMTFTYVGSGVADDDDITSVSLTFPA